MLSRKFLSDATHPLQIANDSSLYEVAPRVKELIILHYKKDRKPQTYLPILFTVPIILVALR